MAPNPRQPMSQIAVTRRQSRGSPRCASMRASPMVHVQCDRKRAAIRAGLEPPPRSGNISDFSNIKQVLVAVLPLAPRSALAGFYVGQQTGLATTWPGLALDGSWDGGMRPASIRHVTRVAQ